MSHTFFLKSTHFERLKQLCNAKDLDGIRKFLESDFEIKPVGTLDEEKVKKQIEKYNQEIIALKIKNRRELIHDLKVSPDLAVKITNGEVAFEKVFETDKQNNYLHWVGTKLICNGCCHEHYSVATRACTRVECNCQVNIIEL